MAGDTVDDTAVDLSRSFCVSDQQFGRHNVRQTFGALDLVPRTVIPLDVRRPNGLPTQTVQ